jgi:biofilm PGA synthesis N-glycosyltransferase PgaC
MIYMLITAARNEALFIEQAILSIISQTVLPEKWIIVNDGSTDNTDEIIRRYTIRYQFIRLLRLDSIGNRSFASQAFALNHAIKYLKSSKYDYLGCFDADITVDRDYYEKLITRLHENSDLGIAGGWIYEYVKDRFISRPYNSRRSVPGAIQMFSKECIDKVGLFTPIPTGGLDVIAEQIAKINGFGVEAFPDLAVYHHRRTGTSAMIITSIFKSGIFKYLKSGLISLI